MLGPSISEWIAWQAVKQGDLSYKVEGLSIDIFFSQDIAYVPKQGYILSLTTTTFKSTICTSQMFCFLDTLFRNKTFEECFTKLCTTIQMLTWTYYLLGSYLFNICLPTLHLGTFYTARCNCVKSVVEFSRPSPGGFHLQLLV